MKKHYYMRTEHDVTTVYECDVYYSNDVYFPIMKTSRVIGEFSSEWRAEKFVMEMRKKQNEKNK